MPGKFLDTSFICQYQKYFCSGKKFREKRHLATISEYPPSSTWKRLYGPRRSVMVLYDGWSRSRKAQLQGKYYFSHVLVNCMWPELQKSKIYSSAVNVTKTELLLQMNGYLLKTLKKICRLRAYGKNKMVCGPLQLLNISACRSGLQTITWLRTIA